MKRTIPYMRYALLIAACALAQPALAEPVKLSKTQVAEIKRGTAAEMRDPNSATFAKITGARSSTGALMICGLVNGTNGYGGFAGNRPFMGMFDNGAYKLVISEDARGTFGVAAMCGKLGIDPTM